MPTPVILDTDLGDDIDDAFALALICACPELELRAVTTVYGDTVERSRLARSVLAAAGRRDVPVAAGCPGGLSVRHRGGLDRLRNRDGFNQAGVGLPEAELQPQDRRHAVDLLIDTIMTGDGDVVPITIGAMTNLAMAMIREPRLVERIPRVVVMAAEFERGFCEWNIRCDPVAAEVVFSSGLPVEVTPWMIGHICTMTEAEVAGFRSGTTPLSRVVAECMDRWINRHPTNRPHLYDPMAVATMVLPDLCTWKTGTVTVETNGTATYGFTTFAGGDGRHRIQVGVDRDRAMRFILDRVTAHGAKATAVHR